MRWVGLSEQAMGAITWSKIKVPRELHQELMTLSKREGIAAWKIVHRALSYWRAANREHHANHSKLDKLAWHVYKLSSSVGELRGLPSPHNLDLLDKTCSQVEERFKVNTSMLRVAARLYLKQPSSQNRMALNDAAKSVIAEILSKAAQA